VHLEHLLERFQAVYLDAGTIKLHFSPTRSFTSSQRIFLQAVLNFRKLQIHLEYLLERSQAVYLNAGNIKLRFPPRKQTAAS
jgi:hypothetical protein